MKCPGCNKFAAQEQGDPEIEEATIDDKGHVEVSVRIVVLSECCNEELKEATLAMEGDLPKEAVEAHTGEACELEVEAEAASADKYEGKGRGARHFYGADVTVAASCACGKNDFAPLELSDYIRSSDMDEV